MRTNTSPPPCPRLSRASTPFLRAFSEQDVDGRDKPGHDSPEWFDVTGTRSQTDVRFAARHA